MQFCPPRRAQPLPVAVFFQSFPFKPKFVAIYGYAKSNNSASSGSAVYNVTTIGVYGGKLTNINGVENGTANYMGAVDLVTTWGDTSITWYGYAIASMQLNESGMKYYYVALG